MIIALYNAEVMEKAMAESHREKESVFSVCAPVNIIELLCNTCQVRHGHSNLAQQVAGTKKKRIKTVFTSTYIHRNVNYGYYI